MLLQYAGAHRAARGGDAKGGEGSGGAGQRTEGSEFEGWWAKGPHMTAEEEREQHRVGTALRGEVFRAGSRVGLHAVNASRSNGCFGRRALECPVQTSSVLSACVQNRGAT